MSDSVRISYSSLDGAAREAQQAASALEAYRAAVAGSVYQALKNVPGTDSAGTIAQAAAAAGRKRRELLVKKQKFQSLARQLARFRTQTRRTDQKLGGRIRVTGASCLGTRSLAQGMADRLYETFCILIPGRFSVTKTLADGIRLVDSGRYSLEEDLKDWFCYGEGKYWGNIGKSAIASTASAAGAAAAFGAVAVGAAPAVLVVTGAGALASGTIAVITAGNSGFAVAGNIKALISSREGKLGLSRFQGSVKGFSDYVKTHDLGDEKTNEDFARAAKNIELVKSGAGAVSILLGALSLGAHTSSVTGRVDGYSVDNIKENVLKSLGFKKTAAVAAEGEAASLVTGPGRQSSVYRFSPEALLQSRKGARWHKYLQSYLGLGKTDRFFYGTLSSGTLEGKFEALSVMKKGSKIILEAGSLLKSTGDKLESMRKISRNILQGEEPALTGESLDAWLSLLSFLKPVSSLKKWVISPARLAISLSE